MARQWLFPALYTPVANDDGEPPEFVEPSARPQKARVFLLALCFLFVVTASGVVGYMAGQVRHSNVCDEKSYTILDSKSRLSRFS
jgi:hypothetical protein